MDGSLVEWPEEVSASFDIFMDIDILVVWLAVLDDIYRVV